jgi:AbrB family looped-hinge helix DNA binding protein
MPRKTIVAEAKVTSKGQITIPGSVRKELGLETGARIRFEGTRGDMRVVPARQRASFQDFVGIGNPGIPEGVSVIQFFRELRGHDDIA